MENILYTLIILLSVLVIWLTVRCVKYENRIRFLETRDVSMVKSNLETHKKLRESRISLVRANDNNVELSVYNAKLGFVIDQSIKLIEITKIRLITDREKYKTSNKDHVDELTKICAFMKCNSKDNN